MNTQTNEHTFGNFLIEEEEYLSDGKSSENDRQTNEYGSTYEQSFKESYDEWRAIREQQK